MTDATSGVEVGVLEGYSAVSGSGAAIRIEFDDPADWQWALDLWRSLRDPAECCGPSTEGGAVGAESPPTCPDGDTQSGTTVRAHIGDAPHGRSRRSHGLTRQSLMMVADLATEEDQCDDRDDRDQREDEGVFRKPLASVVARGRRSVHSDAVPWRYP